MQNVKSIYQLGSVSDPGISDIDILVIFSDNTGMNGDPRNVLDSKGKYLFTHQLFAIHESMINEFAQYYSFSNYRHLFGKKYIEELKNENDKAIDNEVKIQVAMEYLIKFFISLTVQRHFGIIKLRSFLLEAKAVSFDLTLLNISGGELFDIVQKVILVRKTWFEKKINDAELFQLFDEFYIAIKSFLTGRIDSLKLALLPADNYEFSKNIFIVPAGNYETLFLRTD